MPRLPSRPDDPRRHSGQSFLLAGNSRHIMIRAARLQIDVTKNSKPSRQRSRLVSSSSETLVVDQDSHILPCAGLLNSPHRGPPRSIQHLLRLPLSLPSPIHQSKPIAQTPSSGLVQPIFGLPARL